MKSMSDVVASRRAYPLNLLVNGKYSSLVGWDLSNTGEAEEKAKSVLSSFSLIEELSLT